MISVTGSPQKRAERPRTSRPSERSSSALGTGAGTTGSGAIVNWGSGACTICMRTMVTRCRRSECEVGIILQPAFIFVEQPHGFRRLHAIRFDGFVDLGFHKPFEVVFVI